MKMNKAREQLIKMYTDSLKENILPWKKGWDEAYCIHHYNPISNTKYKGINNSLLSIVSFSRGYKDPRWLTYNQIKQNGWVLEDAKGQGVPIEFWSVYDTANKTTVSLSEYSAIIANNPVRKKDFKMMDRIYYVFNATYVKGIPEFVIEEQPKKLMNPSPFIDHLIKNMDVQYEEQGNRAFYSPSKDLVVVPESQQFHNQYEYDSTRLHELCHATAHPSRLNRDIANAFGSTAYAKEELRAEISASFIAQEMDLDISQIDLDNHKAYIQSWIQTLEKDPNELFKAIKDANHISDYVMETGELEKYRLQEAGEVIEAPEVVSLENFLAEKELSFPVSDYMIDKTKIPHGLTHRQWGGFEKDAYSSINDYHEKRKAAIKEYDQLVKEGKIRPQTSIERYLEVAHGNPDKDATIAARRMLTKKGVDWFSGQPIASNLLEPRYFIDMDGTLVHFNNTILNLDVLHEQGYYSKLAPQERVVEITKELLLKYPGQVYVLSATLDSPYVAKEKIEWLQEHLSSLPQDHIILSPYGHPKYDYVPGGIRSNDVLLDDYTKNLIEWTEKGGKSVKLINSINHTNRTWTGPAVHYQDKELFSKLEKYAFRGEEIELVQDQEAPILSISVNYQNGDFNSIKNDLEELNQLFTNVLKNPNDNIEIRVSLSRDGIDILKNERIDYEHLVSHEKSIYSNQDFSLVEILKDRAKANILMHRNPEVELNKFRKLEELFEQMSQTTIIEESVVIGI